MSSLISFACKANFKYHNLACVAGLTVFKGSPTVGEMLNCFAPYTKNQTMKTDWVAELKLSAL
jgi:hypothetical protein